MRSKYMGSLGYKRMMLNAWTIEFMLIFEYNIIMVVVKQYEVVGDRNE